MSKTGPQGLSEEEIARLTRIIMRRQVGLSLRVAAVFLTILLGLPLVNFALPGLAQARVLGFPASWLFLGVLFYPITVALSLYFVRRSDEIEAQCADWRSILGRDEEDEGA